MLLWRRILITAAVRVGGVAGSKLPHEIAYDGVKERCEPRSQGSNRNTGKIARHYPVITYNTIFYFYDLIHIYRSAMPYLSATTNAKELVHLVHARAGCVLAAAVSSVQLALKHEMFHFVLASYYWLEVLQSHFFKKFS